MFCKQIVIFIISSCHFHSSHHLLSPHLFLNSLSASVSYSLMKVPVETPKHLKQLWPLGSVCETMMNACLCVCVHVHAYICMHVCISVHIYSMCGCVHMYIYVCVYAGDSVCSWSSPSSATNPMYGNGNSDGGITMMENPPIWYTQMDGIKMMENPANVAHVYVQIYPMLPTRPRSITSGHPSTYNTSDSTSDPYYI